MINAKPLPAYLKKRYQGWKATEFEQDRPWYERLADEGQRPRAMVISCCDSRVHVTSIFGASSGDFFIHRNIANLVPPFSPDGTLHGTSAAIEYAVQYLRVANILLVGHSSCGGVEGCYNMCTGQAPDLEDKTSFVGRWMDILRPGFETVSKVTGDKTEALTLLEKESIRLSLANLMTFPFVEEAVKSGSLDFHGLWHDIRSGSLEYLDPKSGQFEPV